MHPCKFALTILILVLTANVAAAQVPDPANSSASVTPGLIRAAWSGTGPGLYESLGDQGHPITVTILDAAGVPVPGVDPSRIRLGWTEESTLEECVPLFADGPTDASGVTTISGHFEAAGVLGGDDLVVLLDGVPLGSGGLPLLLATPDRGTLGSIDLLDVRGLEVGLVFTTIGDYIPQFDLSRDGVVDENDRDLLAPAIGAECSELLAPKPIETLGAAGLYFDAAGTVTSQTLAVGDEFSLHLFIEFAPGAKKGVNGVEFSIPALAGPDVDLLIYAWDSVPGYEFPVREYISDGDSYFMAGGPFESIGDRVRIATLRCRVNSPVVGLSLELGGLPPEFSSFEGSPRAGWVSGSEFSLYDFALEKTAIINPVTGVVWSGFDHEPIDGASITPLGEGVELLGLGTMSMPIGGIGGAGGSGADGSYMEFLSDLDAQNLPDAAFLLWSWNGANSLPAIQLLADANAGQFNMSLDMQGLNSGPPELVLRNGGDVVEVRQGYSGLWTALEGLPDAQRVLYQDGEVEFWQGFDSEIEILLDDQSAFIVDEIALRSDTGGSIPRDWLRELRLEGDQLPAIQLGREGIQRFDQVLAGAENLLYLSEGPVLNLVAEDSAQPSSAIFSSTDGNQIGLAGYPPPWPPNSPPVMTYRFQDSADPSGPDLGLVLSDSGGDIGIEFDLSTQQTSLYQVTASLAGEVVDQYLMTAPDVGKAQDWSGFHGMEGQAVVLRWSASTIVDLTPPPGAAARQGLVELDELRLEPVQAIALPDGRRMELTFVGTERYSLTSGVVPTSAPHERLATLQLRPNRPNPFNPSTELRFTLERPGRVNLSIYDLRGRRIATVLDDWRDAGDGAALWSGQDDAGRTVASGVYHAVLRTGDQVRSRKISLIK